MNKKQLLKLKKIIHYDGSRPEHKRLIRRLKKQYLELPPVKRVNLIEDSKKTFGAE